MRGRICISLSNAVFLSRVQDYRSIKDVKLSDVNARMPTNPAQKRKKKKPERIYWTQPGPKKTRQCEIRGPETERSQLNYSSYVKPQNTSVMPDEGTGTSQELLVGVFHFKGDFRNEDMETGMST